MLKPAKATTVADYIAQIDEPRRTAIQALHAMISKAVPKLTPSIQYGMIGYGSYHYQYDSGREGEAPIIALASQKGYISIYGCGAGIESCKRTMPKANFGKGCIRFKKFEDIDLKALEKIVKAAGQAKAAAAGR